MTLSENIKEYVNSLSLLTRENKGVVELTMTVAERKTLLSKKKLEYKVKYRIDDTTKILKFTEMLKESGSGLVSGDTSPGFGFKTETYTTSGKKREGTIEEQSSFLNKKYNYTFDFKIIRTKFEFLATEAGYQFQYQITDKGL